MSIYCRAGFNDEWLSTAAIPYTQLKKFLAHILKIYNSAILQVAISAFNKVYRIYAIYSALLARV
jgi:hypothetical protein